MRNKKTSIKLVLGLLSMSVMCMMGKGVSASQIDCDVPLLRAVPKASYYQAHNEDIRKKKAACREAHKEDIRKKKAACREAYNEERARVADKLRGFDLNRSISFHWFTGLNINGMPELLRHANMVSERTGIEIGEYEKINKVFLYKWFDDNWAAIYPWLLMNY